MRAALPLLLFLAAPVFAQEAARTDKDVTEAVVIEPKTRSDRQTKRLTVLVKEGKIRAVQG